MSNEPVTSAAARTARNPSGTTSRPTPSPGMMARRCVVIGQPPCGYDEWMGSAAARVSASVSARGRERRIQDDGPQRATEVPALALQQPLEAPQSAERVRGLQQLLTGREVDLDERGQNVR